MTANDTAQKYYDALLASYDILTDAVTRANDRGLKLSRQFLSDVSKGQREALELGRTLAAEPANAGLLYAAILDATTAAQGRALAFAKAAYEEALGATNDTRDTIENLVEANRETSKAAVEVARRFATANAFGWKANTEAAAPKASKPAPSEKPADKVTP